MTLAFVALLAFLPMSKPASTLRVEKLRVEHLADPLGIDETKPRFSWILQSNERGQKQTAYRLIVASSPALLQKDQGDLWDSGKVKSDETVLIEYAGKPLKSRQQAWWKVQALDAKGEAAISPRTGKFEIGLLNKSDWKGNWIGLADAVERPEKLIGAKWIWYPEGEPAKEAPAGTRHFRFTFEAGKPAKAKLYIAVDNLAHVSLNGQKVGDVNTYYTITTIDLLKHLQEGTNTLLVTARNDGGPAGLSALISMQDSGGQTKRLVTDEKWTTSMDAQQWQPAKVLGDITMAPWGEPRILEPSGPAPHAVRKFAIEKPVRSAILRASAKGLYVPFIDGRRVGKDIFTPGWTDYNKRIQYQSYDVTSLLRPGRHALGFILGDGWYCGHVGWSGRQQYGPKPMLLAQLEIEYADGKTEIIATDGSWEMSTGPILTSDMLMGEEYDARLFAANWARPNGKGGDKPDVQPLGDVPLVAQRSETVQKLEELKPVGVKEPQKGVFIFDLGQNMVGWARLRVQAPAGTKIQMRFAEMLNPDGTLYTANLRKAKQTDTYICSGKGVEVWEPSFTFHGFRYVEVTGFPSTPSLDAITGVVVGSATPKTGTFECSNPMVNQLQHNIFWGQRGNYLEVPTDCPQRDERLGWMGDAQVFIRTATFNNDVSAFMTKWVQDVRDAQSPAGGYSDVTPRIVDLADGAPAWGDAGVIVPWTCYLAYGDKRLLARHYESARKWISYIHEANPDLIWVNRTHNNFGDWLNIADDTPRAVLATAYFAYSTRLVSKMAQVLGKNADHAAYEKLYKDIGRAFTARFVKPDGRIEGDTQTAYLLALWFDLLYDPRSSMFGYQTVWGTGLHEALHETAAQHLIRKIREKNDHLSTGFVGVGYLMPTLTAIGQTDLAYKLLLNDTFPSWGYSIKHGATTIWERWDGWRADKGFQDPGMNSFNHYSLGSVGEWMYNRVAGIDLDPNRPGFKHIVFRPTPGGGLTWAKATYDSVRGRISCSWKIEGGRFVVDVIVPPSCTATLHMPDGSVKELESGRHSASVALR